MGMLRDLHVNPDLASEALCPCAGIGVCADQLPIACMARAWLQSTFLAVGKSGLQLAGFSVSGCNDKVCSPVPAGCQSVRVLLSRAPILE